MISCAYCGQPATASILSNPSRVCGEHAAEFWTGLLAYAHARTAPCVKDVQECECPLCQAQVMSQARRAAIGSVGLSPLDHADFAMPLAS